MSRRLILQSKDAETLLLSGLDDFLAELLRQVPEAGSPQAATESRLFPLPSGGREPELDAEWREFVRPELESQFSENRDVVAGDMLQIQGNARKGFSIEIPQTHAPAWIHALNQARLSLVARHHIRDEVLEEGTPQPGADGLVLFQIQLYGLIQEWLVDACDVF
jgi:Domain of unknown function (DUF2017)